MNLARTTNHLRSHSGTVAAVDIPAPGRGPAEPAFGLCSRSAPCDAADDRDFPHLTGSPPEPGRLRNVHEWVGSRRPSRQAAGSPGSDHIGRECRPRSQSRGLAQRPGPRWRHRADSVVRRRFGHSPRRTLREHPGRARPASILPRGGSVLPLARLGASSPLPRTARDFSSPQAGQSGGATASPLCPAKAVSGGRSCGRRAAAR